jgi:glutamyl-tRNA(Gln) amidotransferase subunit D
VLKPEFDEKVALLKFYPSMNPALIDWHLKSGYRGLIIEGTGLGHISKENFEAIRRAIEKDVIVAMTSQCIWGRVNMNVYDSGRDLLALGVVPLEDMLSETALVKLMWASAQTKDQKKAAELLKTNLAGELSSRTLFEERNHN